MNKRDEFYIGYLDATGTRTKHALKRFVRLCLGVVIITAIVFGFSQNTFKNSTFELTKVTKITGVYHENPYPMLRVETHKGIYKNIVLLGFGKSSAHPFLKRIKEEAGILNNQTLSIEGNLIYYNGKTLLQITNDEKIALISNSLSNQPIVKEQFGKVTLQGEIIDPKCYFGVMKPGKGKIHRSCAVRCISGGIPPVFRAKNINNGIQYYLITDQHGQAIHENILTFVGKPSKINGNIEKIDDWYVIKVNTDDISIINQKTSIY